MPDVRTTAMDKHRAVRGSAHLMGHSRHNGCAFTTKYSCSNCLVSTLLFVANSGCRAVDKAEGELIRSKAIEEAAELKSKEETWRARMKQMNEQTKAANAVLQGFRAKEKEHERKTEQAIEGGFNRCLQHRGWFEAGLSGLDIRCSRAA